MTEGWKRFRRTGRVHARKVSIGWTWSAGEGDRMQAASGDWRVSDEEGNEWSVAADIFPETYRHVSGDIWERRGIVLARPASPGERIATLEGEVDTRAGDWVVRGEGGEEWPVPAAQFERRYEEVTDSRASE